MLDQWLDAGISLGFIVSSFAGDNVTHCICRVTVVWEVKAEAFKVRLDTSLGSEIDHAACAHEDKAVEGFENLLTWLMDNSNNSHAETSESLQGGHN